MAETIKHLKEVISPAIMEFSIEEWNEIKEYLTDRHSTIQGASVIIDAMGGHSQIKELKSQFQCEMIEAIHSYAKHLHKANDIADKIKETIGTIEKNKQELKKIFG